MEKSGGGDSEEQIYMLQVITNLKAQLQIYKEISEHSRDTIEDIARQPRTQNNNTQNNLCPSYFHAISKSDEDCGISQTIVAFNSYI